VKSVGVGYINIHACENDCILFWKEHENSDSCSKCKVSRWKSNLTLEIKQEEYMQNVSTRFLGRSSLFSY
jgi:hypothetical protein